MLKNNKIDQMGKNWLAIFVFIMIPIFSIGLPSRIVHADPVEQAQRATISDTWGTAPVTFDPSTGVLTVSSGTILNNWSSTTIGTNADITKNSVKEINFLDGAALPNDSSLLFVSAVGFPLFNNLEKISGVPDTSNVTNMSSLFDGNTMLKELDISSWDLSNVTNMSHMFSGCQSLNNLNLGYLNTPELTDTSGMFYGDNSLTSLNVSSWNTPSLSNSSYMFYGDTALTSLDVSGWNTPSLSNSSYMFYGDTALTSLDVSGWDTSHVTNMSNMFYNNIKLSSIKLGVKSIFSLSSNPREGALPEISTVTGEYTGFWVNSSEEKDPKTYSGSAILTTEYDGSHPGVYIWQKATIAGGLITVKYEDEDGKLLNLTTLQGNVDDKYTTSSKDFSGYTLKLTPDNANGLFVKEQQTVTYVYKKNTTNQQSITGSDVTARVGDSVPRDDAFKASAKDKDGKDSAVTLDKSKVDMTKAGDYEVLIASEDGQTKIVIVHVLDNDSVVNTPDGNGESQTPNTPNNNGGTQTLNTSNNNSGTQTSNISINNVGSQSTNDGSGKYQAASLPKTGDNSSKSLLAMATGIFVIALGAIVAVFKIKRVKK